MKEARPNKAIKTYVEKHGPRDWEHADTMRFLYRAFDLARFAFFSPRDERQLPLPQSVIAIDDLRVDTLAAYRLTYNPNGLPFEIMMNGKWLRRPRWELAESLVHEMCHLYQEYLADQKVDGMESGKNGYHNKQWVELAEDVGLHPTLGSGVHWRPADGQFERLMELLGIEKPEHAKGSFKRPEGKLKRNPYWWDGDRGRARGTSSLTLYMAERCPLTNPCKVRAGRKDLNLFCGECGGHFTTQP